MAKMKYVISVKHKYRFEKEFKWKYAIYDIYGGSFSTGVPCWSDNESHAIIFHTVKEAKEWYEKYKKYLLDSNGSIDKKTLAIRKRVYETVEKL